MKFLIDAQLPRRLAHQLRVAGLETTHTLDLPEGNRTTDQALITFSLTQHCIVVTEDSDFVETFLLRHEPWKLLLVSTGNIDNDVLYVPRFSVKRLAIIYIQGRALSYVELDGQGKSASINCCSC